MWLIYQGDLDAILGVVPPYTPKGTPGNTFNIGGLSMDAGHPYHIIVMWVLAFLPLLPTNPHAFMLQDFGMTTR